MADAHVDLESIDNFLININVDSDKLKHRKIHAEIANQPAVKSGRRITITVTSDGKNIVTGRYRLYICIVKATDAADAVRYGETIRHV